ncbi:hypothetical protein D3C72_2064980 [compost metagenome]
MGGQLDALAQLGHHRVARQGDAQRFGQLLARRLQSLRGGQIMQSAIAQLDQRCCTDLLDALERIGDGR